MEIPSGAPIRIALCITELETGGAERCLVELALGLDRRRFEPVVYCLAGRPVGNATSLVDTLEQAGITVHCLGAQRITQFPRVVVQLRRQLAAQHPQIVQTFLFHANIVGSLAACWAGIPHVLTGIRVAEPRFGWYLALERWTSRWVERHVCVSDTVREFSVRVARLPADKLVVIPNGVEVARFSSVTACPAESLGLRHGRRAIACIGRLDPQKGADWLLRLMPGVFAELPDHDLLLVGAGDELDNLRRIASQSGFGDQVHFLGFRNDVPGILAASDLLVLPSGWEGMPNVVLEAMAAARPVVATDVAGVREVFGPSGAQQIAPVGCAEVFSRLMVTILKDSRLANHLGVENQVRVKRHYSRAAMIEAYEQLYLALVNAKI